MNKSMRLLDKHGPRSSVQEEYMKDYIADILRSENPRRELAVNFLFTAPSSDLDMYKSIGDEIIHSTAPLLGETSQQLVNARIKGKGPVDQLVKTTNRLMLNESYAGLDAKSILTQYRRKVILHALTNEENLKESRTSTRRKLAAYMDIYYPDLPQCQVNLDAHDGTEELIADDSSENSSMDENDIVRQYLERTASNPIDPHSIKEYHHHHHTQRKHSIHRKRSHASNKLIMFPISTNGTNNNANSNDLLHEKKTPSSSHHPHHSHNHHTKNKSSHVSRTHSTTNTTTTNVAMNEKATATTATTTNNNNSNAQLSSHNNNPSDKSPDHEKHHTNATSPTSTSHPLFLKSLSSSTSNDKKQSKYHINHRQHQHHDHHDNNADHKVEKDSRYKPKWDDYEVMAARWKFIQPQLKDTLLPKSSPSSPIQHQHHQHHQLLIPQSDGHTVQGPITKLALNGKFVDVAHFEEKQYLQRTNVRSRGVSSSRVGDTSPLTVSYAPFRSTLATSDVNRFASKSKSKSSPVNNNNNNNNNNSSFFSNYKGNKGNTFDNNILITTYQRGSIIPRVTVVDS
eukprot:gene4327-8615_t